MLNPMTLTWQHDGQYEDGAPFGSADYAGTELSLNGQPFVSIPVPFAAEGEYALAVPSLGLGNGDYTAAVRVVGRNGQRSNPSSQVTFSLDNRKPSAPFGLAAS
jgi:hypothetical protein